MKMETMLKTALMLLVVALMVTVTSWVSSEVTSARAQAASGGGGSSADGWMMVASQLVNGDGMIYMFNAKKEVLLIYAFYSRSNSRGASRFSSSDLEFLAGRHCKWDALYSQVSPYPRSAPRSNTHTPAQIKAAFEKLNK
jgi:hypothetical protein